MAGIQISGLLSNSAFDWKSVVDQLIAVDTVPITKLQTEKSKNDDKIAALAEVRTSLSTLQDSLQSIRANNTFNERAVISSDATSSWRSTSSTGAPLGAYKFEVQTLATAARLNGGGDVGTALNATSADLSGLTMNNLPIASSVTAGMFTVNGKQITFSATDSLKSVLDQITTVTSGDVTWSYDQPTDKITLTHGSGTLVLGAANDTSNFLQAMKLANTGTSSSTSTAALATVSTTSPLASARLRGSITAVDGNGDGSFSVNGVSIAYNVNTDSLNTVLERITNSTANVTATYDASNDRVILTNKTTGDVGLTVTEASGGLMDALNLTSSGAVAPTFVSGTNAKYRLNDGDWISSASNTIDSGSHGITGLSVTVNSTGTQTLTVQSDTSSMQTAIQDFITKFNDVQDLIEEKTKVTSVGGKITTSILSDNREIQSWARQLQQMAFDAVSGMTGTVDAIDDLGIDFDGITGHLAIKDPGKLNTVLTNKPGDVQSFFASGSSGMVPQMYGLLTTLMSSDSSQQENIRKSSNSIDTQITTLQSRLDHERETLTTSFISMLKAQQTAQTQNQALTNAFFKDGSS